MKYKAKRGQHDASECAHWEQVAGKWLKGARLRGSGGSLAQKLVGLGYQQVCGDPEVWGDGITPVPAAHLEGECALSRPPVWPYDCLNSICDDKLG